METFEQKYNAALTWMREIYPTLNGANKEDAEHYFPELKESEDERIRKEIIEYLTITREKDLVAHPERQRWIVYLERQGEQKLDFKYWCSFTDDELMITDFWKEYLKNSIIPGNKPTKEDIDFLLPIARKYFCLVMKEACTICKERSNGYQEGLEAGKHSIAEWSKEDEKMRDRILEILNKYGNIPVSGGKVQLRFNKEYMWLRHLYERFRPQSHWKPSEKQMEALDNARFCKAYDRTELDSLYHDLQKLL